MFERYTEAARLTMFHARAMAAKAGSAYVETGHLLLGLLEVDPNPAPGFLKSPAAIDSLRKQLQPPAAVASSTSVDIPLSHQSKRALAYAAEEAERLHDPHISTAHLLMGLLREEQSVAAQACRSADCGWRRYAQNCRTPRRWPTICTGWSTGFREELLDQWYAPQDVFFKVRANDGHIYILRRRSTTPDGEWTLESFRRNSGPA